MQKEKDKRQKGIGKSGGAKAKEEFIALSFRGA
jgi:hypothetical protein